ncbi:hypothetical protein ONE63_005865 [Megalurothrips usitatus]|uniref:Peptidase S1 domain-containing protein n=1 Tax=Megalurothrips usitatus TaxID=439358 RepID=A0AAV7Y3R2_9NEOP|nr:hypothetical protein ONE63_005865 [Megalurothrips usitatus]
MLCAAGKEWAGVCDVSVRGGPRLRAPAACAVLPYPVSLTRKLSQDDEGGPLVDDDGTVVGIVSWGTAGCGYPGYPGVYTNLANKDINSWVRTYVQ